MFTHKFQRRAVLWHITALFTTPYFASPAKATTRPEVGQYVKAFVTADGVKVWTLRYGHREANQALLQITNVDHPLDKKILVAKTQMTGADTKYWIQLENRSFNVLVVTDGSGDLYLPGLSRAKSIRYDDELSSQGNAEHFLTEFQDQNE
ncbi:hypothetical protein RMR16_024855 (plasmid) [Agrobacterium sp. rho-13.3]|uniref:hypothetical protein n=1 Tax=Agrobacterium sp. rho-13.3 TaxID=3072980 RepID=UPI002A115558|nr:hypothetical protein [Agrobacterium sp. rho-13.3]MDX8310183.1 hypothetical protein [Agrobacterium sp. rho-13.3]